jgi:TolB-like protein/DNA-binding winged helix-turn-helix (wHTH) protein
MDKSTEAASDPDQAGFQVDDLTVDIGQQRVTRAGVEIPMPHLSFELLVALSRAAPNLVTFDQLTERVWPGLVITPETISQRVKLVRTALGDDPQAPRYIGGVRGRGYRMVAPVRPLTERRRSEPVTPYWVAEGTSAAAAQSAAQPAPAAPPSAPKPGLLAFAGGTLAVLALLAVPWAATHLFGSARSPPAANGASVLVRPPHTIAVLPLVDVTPGDGNAYLGDGLAQELAARLGRIHGLRVASRTSAFAFRDREADVRTIAQTLGVRHVLEGSVMRQGNQLRVTAQLVDADSGYNVWSQTYNRTWQDLVAIQDEVARSIVSTLQVVLASEAQAAHPPTTRVDAFDLYLAGLAKLQGPGRATQLEAAANSFHQALALDPKFALAYAGLCERYIVEYENTRSTALVAQAESACGAALKLDGSLREVSAALAHLYLVSGRPEQAATLYRDAIRADPDDADGYMGLGEALDGQQHGTEAEHAFRRAVDVEPTYWEAQTALGNFLFRHGRAAAAIPVYRRVTELIPASPFAFNNLGAALEMTADFGGAAAAPTPIWAPSTISSAATRTRRACSGAPPSSPPRTTACGGTWPTPCGRSTAAARRRRTTTAARSPSPSAASMWTRRMVSPGCSSPITARAPASRSPWRATRAGRWNWTPTMSTSTTTRPSWPWSAGTRAVPWTHSAARSSSATHCSWCAQRLTSRRCATTAVSANSSAQPTSHPRHDAKRAYPRVPGEHHVQARTLAHLHPAHGSADRADQCRPGNHLVHTQWRRAARAAALGGVLEVQPPLHDQLPAARRRGHTAADAALIRARQ